MPLFDVFSQLVTATLRAPSAPFVTPVEVSVAAGPTWLVDAVISVRRELTALDPQGAYVRKFFNLWATSWPFHSVRILSCILETDMFYLIVSCEAGALYCSWMKFSKSKLNMPSFSFNFIFYFTLQIPPNPDSFIHTFFFPLYFSSLWLQLRRLCDAALRQVYGPVPVPPGSVRSAVWRVSGGSLGLPQLQTLPV